MTKDGRVSLLFPNHFVVASFRLCCLCFSKQQWRRNENIPQLWFCFSWRHLFQRKYYERVSTVILFCSKTGHINYHLRPTMWLFATEAKQRSPSHVAWSLISNSSARGSVDFVCNDYLLLFLQMRTKDSRCVWFYSKMTTKTIVALFLIFSLFKSWFNKPIQILPSSTVQYRK